MRVGFVGLGKLGLPVAVSMAMRGALVMGFDVDHTRMSKAPQNYREAGPDGTGDFNDWLAKADNLGFGNLEEVIDHAEILFVAVQTPHDARFGGTVPITEQPVDFDYRYLIQAVEAIVEAKRDDRPLPLVVISTVLPGTMDREIKPRLGKGLQLVYNPFFIAMGTVMRDFLNPEFVLLGVDDKDAAFEAETFYLMTLPKARLQRMSVASAELTKVAYNTYISTKIALANSLMEICHKTPGANVDDVTGALKAATYRLVSPAYMDGGMGDGGGCHPRDNIAMMWLGKKIGLSYNPSEWAMKGREKQSAWLADLVGKCCKDIGSKLVTIAGYAFKPGTNITVGSPALLLSHQLTARGFEVFLFDPHVMEKQDFPLRLSQKEVVIIGCRHPEFIGWDGAGLPKGTVVIDPHRILGEPADADVTFIKLGIGPQHRVHEILVRDGMEMAEQ